MERRIKHLSEKEICKLAEEEPDMTIKEYFQFLEELAGITKCSFDTEAVNIARQRRDRKKQHRKK